jgi:hypothetical protein
MAPRVTMLHAIARRSQKIAPVGVRKAVGNHMNLYSLALFVHLVGVLAIFAGIGVWFFAALALRHAKEVAQIRALAGLTGASGNVAVGGVLLVAVGGIYMALTTLGWQTAWIDVATVSFALLAPFGVAVIDPRIRALAKAADMAPDGPLPEPLVSRTRSPLLSGGLSLYFAVLLGIVFLMTTKPQLVVSVVVMASALALGLMVAALLWWTTPARPRR